MNDPPFWINLPSEITTNILSRLPIRTILNCKGVCKQWLQLLSAPEFAKSHLSISTPGLAVQQADTICKIFEFEDVLELQHHNLHYNQVIQFNPRASITSPNANIWICGSVNGLFFLYDYSGELDTFYICNPITREYIPLPKPEGIVEYPNLSQYGFGVSAITGQYKVVRNFHRCPHDSSAGPCSTIQNYECLVYTIGTRSWRSIPPGAPFGHYHLRFNVFLNGNLHGLVQDYLGSTDMLISCFDLETELFKPFSLPPPPMDLHSFGSLGVLDDCLCFCDSSSQEGDSVVIWVMKEYGVEESWTKQFVVVDTQYFIGSPYDAVYPIKAFKDGDILLEWECRHLFYYSNRTKTCQKLDFIIQNRGGWIESRLHKSSFLSLKSFDWENVQSLS